jgi:hypothetical protein
MSMKKLLQAIKVLQIIAFFSLIQIDYSPMSSIVLEKIYKFATFKVISKEVMNEIDHGIKSIISGKK